MSVEKFIVLYFPFKAKSVCTLQTARRASLISAFILIVFDVQFFFTMEFHTAGSLKGCVYSNEKYGFVFEKKNPSFTLMDRSLVWYFLVLLLELGLSSWKEKWEKISSQLTLL